MNFVLLINLPEFVNDLLNQDHMCESVDVGFLGSENKLEKKKENIYYQNVRRIHDSWG